MHSGGFLELSGGGFTVTGMRNENQIQEAIESNLSDTLMLGLDAEEALAEAAGLLAEAEARFVRLAHPGVSVPPPPRSRI